MKKLMVVMVVLTLLALPSKALAGGGAETGHYVSGTFHYEEEYAVGHGPACYYGEAIRVVYSATNSWTWVVRNGDVRETLVQNGTAQIYDSTGDLLDTRAVHVTERFFDAGTDVAVRREYGTSVWYQVSHDWKSEDLERYQYIWKIPGVYDFRHWNRSGDWRSAWVSGSCQGSESGGGWPPHPPHPFSD